MNNNEMEGLKRVSSMRRCSNVVKTKIVNNLNPICHAGQQLTLKGKFFITLTQDQRKSIPGKFISVQIYSGTEVDPITGKGKLSEKAVLKHDGTKKHDNGDAKTMIYKIRINVYSHFGTPRAFLIQNRYKKRFFLQSASIETCNNHIIHFDCNSWVYPIKKTKSDRLFFSNACYIPSETPRALMELRKEELERLRGERDVNSSESEERKEWGRIYEYDCYNDLSDPEKGAEYLRPILGASWLYPYPRRLRTARKPSASGPANESRPRNFEIYVPSDERFSPNKMKELKSNSIHALAHFLSPKAAEPLLHQQCSKSFESFEDILDLFSASRNQRIEGWVRDNLNKMLPIQNLEEIIRLIKNKPLELPIPEILSENAWVWKDDIEFGRQMLAGTHPIKIQCLKTFPTQSSINPSFIEQRLEGWTLPQALKHGRLFMLDHHEYLYPFLNRINLNGVCAYASRTFLFLRSDGMLKPMAIELSLPGSSLSKGICRVFFPAKQGIEAALWQLAKAHVQANDTVYHQLISHWLHTHAVVEPFIIATKRRLSVMHPIHRLLNPHFKDTMHINALARIILINSGGVLERTLSSGEISMQLSSELYKEWRFDEQGLPADLIKRGMAIKDENSQSGVQLLLQDYPYATDGLEIWVAIKKWVKDFCSFYYKDDESIRSDVELQSWWSEIRTIGHGDKHNETWWYQIDTTSSLVESLTILIWVASAQHAAINFGQYAYNGYPPNRPTLCKKFVPMEGTIQFGEFLKDPDKYFLKMLPNRFEMSLVVALFDVLSRHTSDEVYLGCQLSPGWIDSESIQNRFAEFKEELKEIQARILERNRDPKLKNRRGPAKIDYTLLYPDTSSSWSRTALTCRGIPNSISI